MEAKGNETNLKESRVLRVAVEGGRVSAFELIPADEARPDLGVDYFELMGRLPLAGPLPEWLEDGRDAA